MWGILKEMEERRNRLIKGGPAKEIDKQHSLGKLTARERVEKLFDKGTFVEDYLWIKSIKTGFDIDKQELPGDGVITGIGRINGRPVCAYSHDFTVAGGTFGFAFHHKVTSLMKAALEKRLPLIQIVDSGGERIHDWFGKPAHRPILDGIYTMGGALTMYRIPGISSGVIPQITLMLGPMYAGSAYVPTMADFLIMRNITSFMSVASPGLLKAATYQEVTQEELGGAQLHTTTTGTADFLTETDEEAIKVCRELLTYIPSNCNEKPSLVETNGESNHRDDRLLEIVSPDLSKKYDMHDVICCIVDNGNFLELQKLFAKSIIIGFARFNGQSVGVVANNPAEEDGILSINTCDKQARFIRFCDAFNVPLIFLVDTPGFASSLEQEQSQDGLIRTVPKPVFAICEATVPIIAVHIGKCFGVGRLVMGTLRMGIDIAYSWPSAQVARMNPQEAARIVHETELERSNEQTKVQSDKVEKMLENYVRHSYHSAQQAMVNEIIDPRDTRRTVIRALEDLAKKQPLPRPWRKHSLIPQ